MSQLATEFRTGCASVPSSLWNFGCSNRGRCFCLSSSILASCIASQSLASDIICLERSSIEGSSLSSNKPSIAFSTSWPSGDKAGKFDRFLPHPKKNQMVQVQMVALAYQWMHCRRDVFLVRFPSRLSL